MISLGSVKYSLVYKPYIGFIVTQEINKICNYLGLSCCEHRPLGRTMCVLSFSYFRLSFNCHTITQQL